MNLNTVHHTIRDLVREVAAGRLGEPDAMAKAARGIQSTIACTWVSFGLVRGTAGERVLRSLLAYHHSGRLVTAPNDKREVNGRYFGPLVQRGFFACEDTLADPAFAHLADGFLRPNGVRALMTAAIPAGTAGNAWCTLTSASDRPRRWRAEEVTALRRCAAAVQAHARQKNEAK